MTLRCTTYGGTDFSDDVPLDKADLNDTFNKSNGALGEVRMFALSMTGAVTKATLQGQGWAICDGTTPATQGISSPTITTTPDLQDQFIRMSNDETSGTTGGSDTHNHQFITYISATNHTAFRSDGSTATINLHVAPSNSNANSAASRLKDGTAHLYTKLGSTLPSYYEVAFFIKVKQ